MAVADIDFTAAAVLRQVITQLHAKGSRLLLCEVPEPVRTELDRYGITELVSPDAYFTSPAAVLQAVR